MKTLSLLCFASLACILSAVGAPVGICLHGHSQEAPLSNLGCFEFERVERTANGYRFFLSSGTATVTNYRFRGIIHYKPDLTPGNPEFGTLLKLFEETARATPATRPFLNPKIISMRNLVTQLAEHQQHAEALPRLTIEQRDYFSPNFKGIEDGRLVLVHNDGVLKVDVDKVTDQQLGELVKIDAKASEIKVLEISGSRL